MGRPLARAPAAHRTVGAHTKLGIGYMVEHMKEMLTWHRKTSTAPIGKGYDIEVNEFDFKDDGGIVYEKTASRSLTGVSPTSRTAPPPTAWTGTGCGRLYG